MKYQKFQLKKLQVYSKPDRNHSKLTGCSVYFLDKIRAHKIPLNSIVTYRLFFSTEIVSDILARVSDKNPPNIYEETPLHRAAKNGHDRCIEGCRVLQFWILKKVNPDFIARYYKDPGFNYSIVCTRQQTLSSLWCQFFKLFRRTDSPE